MSVGTRIRAARQKRGFSQGKLANLLGLTAQAVSQWEKDRNQIAFANANQVANILGVDVMWILGEDGSDNEEIKISPSMAAHGDRAPVIDINNSMVYYIYNIQRDGQFDSTLTTIELTQAPLGQCFAIIINDTSMTPEFHVGDMAVFDNAVTPESGDFVVCFLYGNSSSPSQVLFRRYWYYNEPIFGSAHVKFEAINQEHPAIFVNSDLSDPKGSFGHVIATMVEHRRLRQRDKKPRKALGS